MIGRERAQLRFRFDFHHIVEGILENTNRRRNTERRQQFRRRICQGGDLHREIQLDPFAAPLRREQTAARVESRLFPRRQMAILPENVRACQGRVAAEIYFNHRRQPAQIKSVIARNQEGSFRKIHFARDVPEPLFGPGLLDYAHGGWVSGERNIRECIDGDNSNRHLEILVEMLVCFGSCLIVYMKNDVILRAIANERRLRILDWLKDPRKHFPPQVDGDLVKDGVCSVFIARKLRITQPSASEHLNILADVGLIRGKKIKQWTFYKRDEKVLKRVKKTLAKL